MKSMWHNVTDCVTVLMLQRSWSCQQQTCPSQSTSVL